MVLYRATGLCRRIPYLSVSPKQAIMKQKVLFAALICSLSLLVVSCGGKDKKSEADTKEQTTEKPAADANDGMVPAIDTANLKDEASILDAMQKVADARIADEKKQTEDPSYKGHYLELTKLYTAVLKASTAYSQTLTDPNKALEFSNKVSEIQKKMY